MKINTDLFIHEEENTDSLWASSKNIIGIFFSECDCEWEAVRVSFRSSWVSPLCLFESEEDSSSPSFLGGWNLQYFRSADCQNLSAKYLSICSQNTWNNSIRRAISDVVTLDSGISLSLRSTSSRSCLQKYDQYRVLLVINNTP